MAKSEVLVRMKADTQGYDANIAKARRTLDGFVKDNLTLGGVLNNTTKSLTAAAAGFMSLATAASAMQSIVSESVQLAKAGEGVRNAFERLNRPDLLNNLKEATHGTVSEIELMKAAVKFNDFNLPVEQLGTLLAFAQKKAKDTGQSVDYMVDSIVTGLGRKSLMILDNLGLSASQVKDRMAETGDMTTAVASIIKEQMSEAGEYVETAADRAAQAAADAQNQMEELGQKAMPVAEAWTTAWNEIKTGGMELLTTVLGPLAESMQSIRSILSGGFAFKPGIVNAAGGGNQTVWSGWKPGTDHKVQASGGYIEVTDPNTGKVLGGQHFDNLNDANTIKTWQKTLIKTPKSGGSTQKVPTASDFEKFNMKAIFGADSLKGSDDANFLSPYAMMLDDIKEKILDIKDADLGSALNIPDVYAEKMNEMDKNLQTVVKSANITADVVGSIGQAFSSIEDPAAKVAGTVMQAIASIALGYAQSTVLAAKLGPVAWIAFAASGLATMMATISSIHSATGYAEGGMINGNSYSGDNLMAMGPNGLVGLNAGEIILNRAQQANVAAGLQGGGLSGMSLKTKVRGTELLVWLDNSLAQSGRGELVTWGQ